MADKSATCQGAVAAAWRAVAHWCPIRRGLNNLYQQLQTAEDDLTMTK